ncbi:hypothetical protein [Muricoccus radiodurans]|uniref:hypothetical protein n=1 Tax=Muricoccus radiodurans TaxID=2231721 RepID=UPI003CFA48E3
MPPQTLPGLPLETLSDGLDLAALRRADRAVEDAAARARAGAIRDRLENLIAVCDPALRALAEALIAEIGRADARAEAAAQAALETRRSRGEWISLDPLRHIPEGRAAPPPPPPRRVAVHAADPAFHGFGWHSAEGTGAESWRWSGTDRAASIILPSLGGGRLMIRLDVVAPFQAALDASAITVLANGQPLELLLVRAAPSRATLGADYTAPEDGGHGSLVLVLLGPSFADAAGPDTRVLGVGLRSVTVERD